MNLKNQAYYNENDPYNVEWLRNLIRDGLIAPGEVDGRSIRDVQSEDLKGFTQAHFFAGIGGWSYALRLAGWPDDRPVFTGSPPCQGFSIAGKKRKFDDERHLWPEFFRIIQKRRPETIFMEQVASKDGLEWLDSVYDDLEEEDYAVAAFDLCAPSVQAFHRRQRLYIVGDSVQHGYEGWLPGRTDSERKVFDGQTGRDGTTGGVWDPQSGRVGSHIRESGENPESQIAPGGSGVPSAIRTPWDDIEWIYCKDGKYRPVEPGLEPVVNGVSGRVVIRRTGIQSNSSFQNEEKEHWYNRAGALNGFGNAIVPQVAAEFIKTFMECKP